MLGRIIRAIPSLAALGCRHGRRPVREPVTRMPMLSKPIMLSVLANHWTWPQASVSQHRQVGTQRWSLGQRRLRGTLWRKIGFLLCKDGGPWHMGRESVALLDRDAICLIDLQNETLTQSFAWKLGALKLTGGSWWWHEKVWWPRWWNPSIQKHYIRQQFQAEMLSDHLTTNPLLQIPSSHTIASTCHLNSLWSPNFISNLVFLNFHLISTIRSNRRWSSYSIQTNSYLHVIRVLSSIQPAVEILWLSSVKT